MTVPPWSAVLFVCAQSLWLRDLRVCMYRMRMECPSVMWMLRTLNLHCQHALSMLSRLSPRPPRRLVCSRRVSGGGRLHWQTVMWLSSVSGVFPTCRWRCFA